MIRDHLIYKNIGTAQVMIFVTLKQRMDLMRRNKQEDPCRKLMNVGESKWIASFKITSLMAILAILFWPAGNLAGADGLEQSQYAFVGSVENSFASSDNDNEEANDSFNEGKTNEDNEATDVKSGEEDTDEGNETNEVENIEGISQVDPTHVYKEASSEADVWKSYKQGTKLEYRDSDKDGWYEASVHIDNEWQTGYIDEDDVDDLVDNQEERSGYAQHNIIHVYDGAYDNANILKNYDQGDEITYKTYSSNWYEAEVYIDDEKQTGYIHKDDADEEKPEVPEDIEGVAQKDPTPIYKETSTDAGVWKKYEQDATLKYHEMDEDGWFEASVYADGHWRTGYIQKDDVGTTVEEMMETIIEPEFPDGTLNGISIRDAGTGESLYSNLGDKGLRPASNMKLLTTTAAMETLGPEYTFSTEVLADGDISDATLDGDLYLKGQGDPTLLEEDLDSFSEELKNQGIDEINGDIIGDDTWFDDVRLPPDIPWSDEPYYFGAPISALTLSPDDDFDTGTVIVQVEPADEAGEEPEVTTDPETDQVEIVNDAETVEKGEESDISVEREHGTNEIEVQGNISEDADSIIEWSSVWHPTEYATDVFKQSLEDNDIEIGDDVDIERGETPDDAEKLLSDESMPLKDILVPFLKKSNNGHAEILTKEMGRQKNGEGTWPNGLDVINDVITALGLNDESILLRDGSGLSDKTIIPAEELSRLLYNIQNRYWYSDMEEALPVAGESGTLSDRLTGDSTKGNVTAKTGSLTGVNTLSGHVTTQDGEKLIFSILNNNFDSEPMMELQDHIVTELAENRFIDND